MLPIWSLRGIPGTERTVWLLKSHVHCSSLAARRHEWEPRARGGPGALLGLAAGCACCRPWLLCSYLYTAHTHSLLLPSLPQICLGHAMPCCHPMPGSEQVQGGRQEYEGGGMGASLVSLLTAAETESNSVEIDEVTLVQTWGHQVSEFGLCYLMAQPDQWLCRVVPDVLEPALTGLVECLAAPAFPDCFEC